MEPPKPKSRMQRVREAMGLSQAAMARELRVSQPLVCAIEGGGSESGPISKLLDILEAQLAANGAHAGASSASTPEQGTAA
ncbi:hypothetical protein [Phreatobacter sp.]|uniref:hypothetical protein n=1 Tax=Phreatobacter sp. TaxID=1966341 RepID=UPI003F6F5D3B